VAVSLPGLLDLGRRVRARRDEARLDVSTLAALANVDAPRIEAFEAFEAFEAGEGGLGVAELMRIANALGVPGTSFVHTRAPIVPAPLDPAVVLKGPGAAWLDDRDRDALAQGLRRTRAFTEAGELLGAPRLAESFGPRNPPERNAHQPGYDAALAVRAQLARPGPLRGLARLLEDKFDVLVLRHRFGDPRVLARVYRPRTS
jgi:transcriptional regulator with XRE-family HTH domain